MTRFNFGDKVTHNGRPAVVAAVFTDEDGRTRYHVYYEDGDMELKGDLLGRVLDAR